LLLEVLGAGLLVKTEWRAEPFLVNGQKEVGLKLEMQISQKWKALSRKE
jgi:hypothetical protein